MSCLGSVYGEYLPRLPRLPRLTPHPPSCSFALCDPWGERAMTDPRPFPFPAALWVIVRVVYHEHKKVD